MFTLLRPAAAGALALALTLLVSAPAAAQQLMPVPKASPKACVMQVVGLTEVTVSFHRPAVKGREIWGGVVPYDAVWRAGANDNTTVAFSSPVKVNGADLPAGTYGLHMIPTKGEWTVIFSRNANAWGSYSYAEKDDALRVAVTPVAAPATEWLDFEFSNLSAEGCTLSLRWGELAVPMQLGVDTQQVVLENARTNYLPGLPATYWQGPNSAAAYCLRYGINLQEALTWSDRSLASAQNTTNLSVKAGLLEALGRATEAEPLRRQALAAASEAERNAIGYQYLQANDLQKALEVFKANVAAHPESWNTQDSLAEASALSGDTKAAIEHYTKALQLVKDDAQKTRIEGVLKELGAL